MQNDMIKPAIEGVINVMKACAKAGTVKRVVFTSSAATVSINQLNETGLVMDENNWTDVEFLTSVKPPTWVNYYFPVRICNISIKHFLEQYSGYLQQMVKYGVCI